MTKYLHILYTCIQQVTTSTQRTTRTRTTTDTHHYLLLPQTLLKSMIDLTRLCKSLTATDLGIARELLDQNSDALESTALKFRTLCLGELEVIAVSGCVPCGSRTRAILLMSASLVKLDIQEVEGLNSMVKTAVARAGNNRITLPLLSSRVCMRKLISLGTQGSTRIKQIKPFAGALARSAFLFSNDHQALMDDENRWRPPTTASMTLQLPPADRMVFDPQSEEGLDSSGWACKYHSMFMKMFKQSWKSTDKKPNQLLALVTPSLPDGAGSVYWVGCSIAHSQALMIKLVSAPVGRGFLIGDGSRMFHKSLEIIASLCELVGRQREEGRANLKLFTHKLVLKEHEMEKCLLFEVSGRKTALCELRARYQRKKKTGPKGGDKSQPLSASASTATLTAGKSSSSSFVCHAIKDDNDHNLDDLFGDVGSASDIDDSHDSNASDSDWAVACVEQRTNRDQEIRRMLFDDLADMSDSELSDLQGDDKQDLEDLFELNRDMAVLCANRCADENEHVISKVADTVQDRLDSTTLAPIMTTLADSDQQQEALLQEVLTGATLISSEVEQQHASFCRDKSPDRLPQNVSTAMEDCFLETWSESVRKSCDALAHRLQNKNRSIGENSELSLVLEIQDASASVCLVQWSSTNICNGRIIHLDEQNRIVCPVNFMQKARTFVSKEHFVLLPAVGECVRKVRKIDRPYLPGNALVLMQMFQRAIDGHVRDSESGLALDTDQTARNVCAICQSGGDCSGHDDLRLCALCGQNSHVRCSDNIVSKPDRLVGISACVDISSLCLAIIPNILLGGNDSGLGSSSDRSAVVGTSWSSCLVAVIYGNWFGSDHVVLYVFLFAIVRSCG